jgi:SnoaL-like domain
VNTDTLAAIEEIKQLKARYFRLLDTKQWDEWATVFTADLDAWIEDTGDINYSNRDQFVAFVRGILADAETVHHGHMPEIDVTGPDTARGTWAMFDYVKLTGPERPLELKGYGHYHEEYRRGTDGRWRISSLRLHRLHVDHL